MKGSKLTADQEQQILDLLRQGTPMNRIAAMVNVAENTVRSRRLRHAVAFFEAYPRLQRTIEETRSSYVAYRHHRDGHKNNLSAK